MLGIKNKLAFSLIIRRYGSKKFGWDQGANMCGSDKVDLVYPVILNVAHSGPTEIIVITSILDEDAGNESWGFRGFILSVHKCPDGCSVCQGTDTVVQCKLWWILSTSQTQLKTNEIVSKWLDYNSRIP
ncbi:unnamed protein product [Paramecium octaurelia]|uniref:Uncharacterized protein n=1 Tax=Paramecium octaurelia TaxID=43137 RepID=A0A8S1V4G5_PAROT|nr:unnamed protein product [Paramecium octaurelia]